MEEGEEQLPTSSGHEGEAVDEEIVNEGGFWGCLWAPIYWVRMLAMELHWSFVFGVVVVYGISQGFGGALSKVGTEYYMKDVQKVQPSEAQVYSGITSIPWLVKPLWGLLTDVVPISGYRRRPYFVFAGKHIVIYFLEFILLLVTLKYCTYRLYSCFLFSMILCTFHP